MGSLFGWFDKIVEVMGEFFNDTVAFFQDLIMKLIVLVQDLLKVDANVALYIVIGLIALVFILLVLIIVLCCVSSKKRKAKKAALRKQEESATEETLKVKEEIQEVEEVQEVVTEEKEEPKVEATEEVIIEKKEEPSVEATEEVTIEEKEEPSVEATEEVVTEEKVQKEVEPVKEEVVEETKTTRIAIGKYEVFPVNEVFLYRLKASNGEIMVTSEIYKSAKGAVSAIETVKKNVETGTLQVYQDKHGLYQFKLFAANKRLLVVSANYTSEVSCTNAANSFKKFATISPVVILDEDVEHLMEEIKLEALADKKGGKLTINNVNGEYDFKLLASNGVVLCSSSEYKTKTAITSAISSVKEAIKNGKFFVVKDKRGTYQFKLYSTAGRCVLVGEAYKSKNQAISAANSVSSFINLATTIDKTAVEV